MSLKTNKFEVLASRFAMKPVNVKFQNDKTSYTDGQSIVLHKKNLGILAHEAFHILISFKSEILSAKTLISQKYLNNNEQVAHLIANIIEDIRVNRLTEIYLPGFFDDLMKGYNIKRPKNVFNELLSILILNKNTNEFFSKKELNILMETRKSIHKFPFSSSNTVRAYMNVGKVMKNHTKSTDDEKDFPKMSKFQDKKPSKRAVDELEKQLEEQKEKKKKEKTKKEEEKKEKQKKKEKEEEKDTKIETSEEKDEEETTSEEKDEETDEKDEEETTSEEKDEETDEKDEEENIFDEIEEKESDEENDSDKENDSESDSESKTDKESDEESDKESDEETDAKGTGKLTGKPGNEDDEIDNFEDFEFDLDKIDIENDLTKEDFEEYSKKVEKKENRFNLTTKFIKVKDFRTGSNQHDIDFDKAKRIAKRYKLNLLKNVGAIASSTGRMNRRSAVKVRMGHKQPFIRKVEKTSSGKIMILIDGSGSMGGSKMDLALYEASILYYMMKETNVEFSISIFTSRTEYHKGINTHIVELCDEKTVEKIFRRNITQYYTTCGQDNADGAAIDYILDNFKSDLFILISDGAPYCSDSPSYRLPDCYDSFERMYKQKSLIFGIQFQSTVLKDLFQNRYISTEDIGIERTMKVLEKFIIKAIR